MITVIHRLTADIMAHIFGFTTMPDIALSLWTVTD
jgi:hypothetical protein